MNNGRKEGDSYEPAHYREPNSNAPEKQDSQEAVQSLQEEAVSGSNGLWKPFNDSWKVKVSLRSRAKSRELNKSLDDRAEMDAIGETLRHQMKQSTALSWRRSQATQGGRSRQQDYVSSLRELSLVSQETLAEEETPRQHQYQSTDPPSPVTTSKQRRHCQHKQNLAPSPTEEYLAQASLSPEITTERRDLLVILDLNGTLIHRKRRTLPPIFEKRPLLNRFLRKLTMRYTVMVWSSAAPPTVDAICRKLFPKPKQNDVIAVWSRDMFGLSASQYRQKIQVYKQLQRVWADEQIQAKHPRKARWDQSNTILIDDSVIKASSEPFNHLQIPEFAPVNGHHVPGEIHVFANLLTRLERLTFCDDVSKMIYHWSVTGDEIRWREAPPSPQNPFRRAAEKEWKRQARRNKKKCPKLFDHTMQVISAAPYPPSAEAGEYRPTTQQQQQTSSLPTASNGSGKFGSAPEPKDIIDDHSAVLPSPLPIPLPPPPPPPSVSLAQALPDPSVERNRQRKTFRKKKIVRKLPVSAIEASELSPES